MKARQTIVNHDFKPTIYQTDHSFDLKEYQKQLVPENLELINQILSLTPISVYGHRDELITVSEDGGSVGWRKEMLLQLDNSQLRVLLTFVKRRIELLEK